MTLQTDGSHAPAPACGGAHRIPFWKGLVLALCAMQIGPALALVTGYQLPWSGVNAWFVLALAAAISCLIAASISYVSRRHGGAGTLLSYVQGVLPHWGVCIVASTLILGYIIGPSTMTMWAAAYVSSILLQLGVASAASPMVISLLVIVVAAIAGYCGYRGLELSARVALALGLISVPAAVAVTVMAVMKHGIDIDYAQALSDVSWPDVARGTFVALGSFIAFDGVCALADQTSDPRRNVTRLLAWTLIVLGITNVLGAFFQTPVLLAHTGELAAGQTPTYVLMHASGLDSLYVAFDAMLCLAEIAGIIAWLNLSALVIAAAARDGFLPRALGELHPRTKSPCKAVMLLTFISAIIPAILQATGAQTLLVSMAYIINVLVLYWMLAYALVCVAAIILHHRNGDGVTGTYVASVAAIAALAVVLVMQDPTPSDQIYAMTGYLGVALLVVATLYLFLATRHRQDALTFAG